MLSEQMEEQVIKALRDTHKFLWELDKIDAFKSPDVLREVALNVVANASRVRAEVTFALHLAGKL